MPVTSAQIQSALELGRTSLRSVASSSTKYVTMDTGCK